jgi:glyoxalase superfamily protein
VIEGRYVTLSGDGPVLSLQRVPEPKAGKNRLHLDLLVVDADGEVARLQALGATVLPPGTREEFGQRWFVLADPEGNELCVAEDPLQDRQRPADQVSKGQDGDGSPEAQLGPANGPLMAHGDQQDASETESHAGHAR